MKEYERRIQQRANSSFMIVIPIPVMRHLGVKKGQSMRLSLLPGKIVLTPSGKDLTKKDLTDIDKYEKAFDAAMERSQKESRKESKEESTEHPKVKSQLDRFKIK